MFYDGRLVTLLAMLDSGSHCALNLCLEHLALKQNLKPRRRDKTWCPSISPVFGGLGQLVLRLLVLSLHAQHEAPTPQLRLRLLQLVGQVKDLTRCVVCILQKCRQKRVVQRPSAWDWSNVCVCMYVYMYVCVCVQMLMQMLMQQLPSIHLCHTTGYIIPSLLWEEFEMCICFATEFDHPEVTLCG